LGEDWKIGLRQAATKLQLGPKEKTAVEAQTQTHISRSTATESQWERPAAPGMPGNPVNSSAFQAPPTKLKGLVIPKGTQANKLAAANPRSPIPPSAKGLRVLPPPFGNPQISGDAKRLTHRLGIQKQVANSTSEPQGRPEFSPPDMAKFRIRHGAANASPDQSWQEVGKATGLRLSENRGKAQCILGLDFGTAFTKACVQFRQQTFVIHWERAVPECAPGLLPGAFSVKGDGICVLGSAPEGHLISDLKMGLLNSASQESRIHATAFLALVTRYIRSWLFGQHASVFRGFQLEWFINVGLPAVPWDDTKLRDMYESIAVAGWNLGTAPGNITVAAAASVLVGTLATGSAQPGQLHCRRVNAFPEFVAQINSYRKSPQGRLDLHMLVDVGAGTVDIVTFHVSEPNEEDRYSILDASVESNGTHVLLGYRATAGELTGTDWKEESTRLRVRDFETRFGLSSGRLQPVQSYFVERFHIAIEKVLRSTKTRRYETSPAWKSGVPFFICGGGREVDAYREAITKVQTERQFMEIQLPCPTDLVLGKLQRKDFHRISVAHGLSYAVENIGQIDRKSQVADLYRTKSAREDYSDRYIEK
jgi:hypothetical protein